MAGKKLTAAERLAKLKAMQGKRGEEFAGGKKKPASEPPRTPAKDEPSVFDKPPAKPAREEPEDKTQGLDLDDSAVVALEDEVPSSGSAPATTADPAPLVSDVPSGPSLLDSVSLPDAPVEDGAPPVEPPSLAELEMPAGLDAIKPSSSREDETSPEVPQRPSKSPSPRTLMSVEDGADPLSALKEPEEKPTEEKKEEPEGVKYNVKASAKHEETDLPSGIKVKYTIASGNNKIFSVEGPSSEESLALAPGDEKTFHMDTPDGKVKVTMQNVEGEVTAYVVGGVTKSGAAMAKAGAVGKFLANVRYYLPEVTMAGLFTAATTAVLWTQQYISEAMQNWHKPAVIAYGAVQLALTTWAIIEQKKNRKAAEAQEAVKE